MPAFPSQQDVLALADRALEHAGAPAQVTAYWERRAHADERGHQSSDGYGVEVVCLDRGIGRAATSAIDDDGLRRVANQARRAAAEGAEPRRCELPDPLAGRGHDGWDPRALSADPAEAAAQLAERLGGLGFQWRSGAARTAIVSTTGVRAFEQRSFARLQLRSEAGGRSACATVSAVGPDRFDLDRALARVSDQHAGRSAGPPEPGAPAVVLGPEAVAVVLNRVRSSFGAPVAQRPGAIAERLGRRVMASCVNLSDSPRFPGILPRSHDAEGVPRQPLPLVQDGVAHRVVRDTASSGGPSTGHATVALRPAPAPLHLVLVGGGAADETELMAGVRQGLWIPALSPDGRRALGCFSIEAGRPARSVLDPAVEVDGLAVLASAQALTMGQQLMAGEDPSARTVGASMCPALRAGAGVRVL